MSNALAPLPDLPPLPDLAAPPTPRVELSKLEKAAIIVRLMVAAGVDMSLVDLPEDRQTALTHQMARMKSLDDDTIMSVVAEFGEEMDGDGFSFPDGLEGALSVLEKTISPSLINRMRKKAGISLRGDPWVRISSLENDKIVSVLENESVEVGAVVLSKLTVAKSAELLGLIPGERARRITYAVSQTAAISPQVVRRIGDSLVAQLDTSVESAFADAPVARVGEILNRSPARTRDTVLDGLEETDKDFAKEVRKAIFTFANIRERVDASDVPKVMRVADQGALIQIIAGAEGADKDSIDFILSNISQRMADSLKAEAEELKNVTEDQVEAAMGEIVQAVRQLQADGEIFLIAGDD